MTENQKRELRTAYYKMMIICTLFYGAFALMVLSDTEDKHVFITLVTLGYFVSMVFLIVQTIKTYIK